MLETIDGIECEYERSGGKSDHTVLFLHGWGGGLESFSGAYSVMRDLGVDAVNFAFPVCVPPEYGIYDYAAYVSKFLGKHKIRDPIIVGHSFGGRVGVILAAQGGCEKLVLTGAAGLKPRFSLRKKIAIARYKYRVKHGKPLDGMGSADYNNLVPEMRGVFVRIVNTHLDKLLPYINCKTLLVWGKADTETPLYMAKRFKRGIRDSELVLVDGGHFGYAESHYGFIKYLKSFVME